MRDYSQDVQEFIENCQVVIIAGGLGQGLKHRTGDGLPKPLLKINDKALIDYCIELFARVGFKNFVLLLGYLADKIQAHVGDGSRYGVRVTYSIEKERLGKGGALKLALENGAIDRSKPCVIAYPDDLITDPDFPQKLIERHLEGLREGSLGTLVGVDRTFYRYGSPQIDEHGFVVDFKEKPPIELPANVAIYVFQPEVYDIIEKVIGDRKPAGFETLVLPELVKNRMLYNHTIPLESWIPVNDEKEFRRAEEVMSKMRTDEAKNN